MATALHHTVSKTINNGTQILTAKISLADDCRNGHQDFSLTGTIYRAGKPRLDAYIDSCGAIGDTIAEHMPELAIFNRLHLCDYDGVPMHAIANMFYFIRNKFNSNNAVDTPEHKAEYCEHYRILETEFDALRNAETAIHFAVIFRDLPILARWKAEAAEAIALLEELTGKAFENNSKRTQLVMPSDAEIQAELDKIASGYYSPEAMNARAEAKRQAKRAELIADAEKRKRDIDLELQVTLAIFDCGVPNASEHSIFYKHTKTVALNWRKYGAELSDSEIALVKANTKLPEGVAFE
jgi:hypothetical protein